MKPRVLLAEDDASVQDMLRFVLKHHYGFEIAGEAQDGISALRLCESLHPELLLADLRLPRLDGIGLLQQLRVRGLHIPTVFYTGTDHEEHIREAIAARPEGFVHKHDTLAELSQALHSVLAGESFYSATPSRIHSEARTTAGQVSLLTPAERAILVLLRDGKALPDIAAVLGVTNFQLAHDCEVLASKLGLNDQVDLLRYAKSLPR